MDENSLRFTGGEADSGSFRISSEADGPLNLRTASMDSEVDGQELLSWMVDGFRDFLVEKNRRYENSAGNPLGIFTRFMREGDSLARQTILVRLDDKMKRIIKAGADGEELRKNDVADLVGYLFLLMREEDWHSFEDLLD